MAIATSLSGLMTKITVNPDVLIVGLAVGYAAGYWKMKKKMQQGGMGGMGGMM